MRAYSGVSLHVRKDAFETPPVFSHPDFDMESRIVQATFGNLVLASVYVPNGNKDYPAKIAFVQRLIAWSQDLSGQGNELVLCGDMNITRSDMDVHPKERKPGIVGQRPEERELFARLLENLVDVGRKLQPDNANMFTWWAPWRNMRQRNIGWRLDYILASPGVAARAESCAVLADVGTSDHAPVMMSVLRDLLRFDREDELQQRVGVDRLFDVMQEGNALAAGLHQLLGHGQTALRGHRGIEQHRIRIELRHCSRNLAAAGREPDLDALAAQQDAEGHDRIVTLTYDENPEPWGVVFHWPKSSVLRPVRGVRVCSPGVRVC